MAAFFFDIDGTLWDENSYIPESTKIAIRSIREQGHLAFLCTGRTQAFITTPELLEIGFDGIVAGCGTQIEYKGEDILYKTIDKDIIKKTTEVFYEQDMPMIMEGKYNLFMDADIMGRDPYGQYLLKLLEGYIKPIRGNEDQWEASKFSIVLEKKDVTPVRQALQDYYDLIIHDDYAMEIVPKGFSKASGIDFVCKHLGIDVKDTYAFGDSANDIQMLDFAGTGIVMGNGSKAAKEHADYITDDLHDDGIYNAIHHFNFI